MIATDAAACYQALERLLLGQTETVENLQRFLTQIKQAIDSDRIESLDQLLTQQPLPIAKIHDLEHERQQFLQGYGFAANRQDLEACILWCDQNAILAQKYAQFKQALVSLQRSIQFNNLLIDKSQNRVRQSLSLLTGQPNSETNRTYSSRGEANRHSSRKPAIARA